MSQKETVKNQPAGKQIDFEKTVYELGKDDPEFLAILAEAGFADVLKPGMLMTAGRFMTVPRGAALKKIAFSDIEECFIRHGYTIKNKGGTMHE